MRTDAPSRPAGLPMSGSVILLAAIGTIAVAQAPAFQRGFAALFALAALLRLACGRDGRRLLPPRVLQALGFSLAAISLTYVLHRLGARAAADAPNALWALMEVTCLFEALVLLWRQRAFSHFLVILFSSVHATGIAFAVPHATGLGFVAAYVVVLAWTLVVFERGAALESEPGREGPVLRVRAATRALLPWRPALRTTALLLGLGLPLGILVYLAAPRTWELGGRWHDREDEASLAAEAGDAEPGLDDRSPGERYRIGRTGPGEGGAPLGSVAEIQRNMEPFFEVRLEGGGLPPTVVLRENTSDTYLVNGTWDSVLAAPERVRVRRDTHDGRSDGWIPLEPAAGPGAAVTLHIDLLKGGNRRLFLQPRATAVSIRRDGQVLAPAQVLATGDAGFETRTKLRTGDVVRQRYVAPPSPEDPALLGRRSDRAVAPQVVYLQVPPAVAGPLAGHAWRVVGTERDPWLRARLLEGWLRSDDFTYTLRVPALDPANPIVDFLDRTRSGHCECYAYALTLMLRTLGHPARYVRGFWGGDVLEERGSVLMRGLHYHAWSEIYLDGIGWMPLNPTPPDRRAVDAGSVTAAREAAAQAEDGWSFDLLGLDAEGWRRFWRRTGHAIDRWVLAPLGALFERETGYAGIWIALVLVLFVRGGRERRRLRRMVAGSGGRVPDGAYGRALLLLARRGVRRPVAWTVGEFADFVGKRFPAAAAPFAALSRAHEARRYGGHAAAVGAEATAWLAALEAGLRRRDPDAHKEMPEAAAAP